MLTPRQKQILSLIIKYYGLEEEPIGSKTLLNRSKLNVSPATVRNDMLALENEGYLLKAHSSSGRIPSNDGYRFYVNQLMAMKEGHKEDGKSPNPFSQLRRGSKYNDFEMAKLAADMLVSLANYPVFVLGQDLTTYHFEEFKLFALDDERMMAVLMTDQGRLDNIVFHTPYNLSSDQMDRVVDIMNQELKGFNLEDVYQRMKLTIPFALQRATGYQLDFSSLIEKIRTSLKRHHFNVSGRNLIYDFLNPLMGKESIKDLMTLVDGSNPVYQEIENYPPGINVLFGFEYSPSTLSSVSMISTTYLTNQQKISIGLIGPNTMGYNKIIQLFQQMTAALFNY
ncbi:heat-inducible transcriptional repressor HrcA [Eremococcus coleocola]|uniref:Heat-inducible transcription repressor HrcA n=1 Tax=Eremococcus coleocola ACS-139-V-Col8 TaxID=908337 RepID=E4KQC0_9LACT|nr:heat-inducible transcriptional repressor HrcA [Eremococcus coleocola]EFR30879.1 heat-inducible transcription repressor HrcA [Eremococcus coleocola ACS-139-V-Col8]